MRISDWSSDVCSSDLRSGRHRLELIDVVAEHRAVEFTCFLIDKRLADVGINVRAADHIDDFGIGDCNTDFFILRREDRKSVGVGKECVVRVDLGGRRILKKKKEEYDK